MPAKKKVTKKKAAKPAKKKAAQPAKKKAVKPAKKKAVKPVKKKAVKPVKKKAVKPVKKKAVKPVKKKAAKSAKKKSTARKKAKRVEIDYSEFQDTIVASSSAGPLHFTPYEAEKGEEYMSDVQIEHFRCILDAWKEQLMSEVDSTVVHLQQDAEAYADPLDRAAQEEGFNLELRTRDRERKLIKKIEQALDWLEEGVYGYCEDCGAEIGIRRLEARPTAAKCIDCKTYSEIREKQVGH